MLPESADARVHACWHRKLTPDELIELLDDDGSYSFGGYVNFDGDATTTICFVAHAAIQALAATAPAAAPVERVAAAMLRLHGRIIQIQTCTYASPFETPLGWSPREVAPFGPALLDALRARLDDPDPDVRRRATEVLADLA